MQKTTAGAAAHVQLAHALARLGAQTVFGLVGDANLFLVKAYLDAGLGRYVPCTHEANAVLAAIGHAQVSGGTGVATITHGPALTNISTALVEAVRAGVPLVVLCGDTPPGDLQHLQKIDQREVIAATGAGFVEMRSAETATRDLERAFRLAAQQRGPVVFNMRIDLQWLDAPGHVPLPLPLPLPAPAPAQEAALEEAVGMLAAARRPLILAGRGAIGPEARAAIIALARRIEAPLATTLKAQGLFRGDAFDLGICGGLSHATASETIAAADCILAFGASLSKHTTENGAFLRGKRVIQILPDTTETLRMEEQPTLRLIGDAALTAQVMTALLDMAEIPGSGATDDALAAALAAEAAALDTPPAFAPTAPGTLDMAPALRRLHQALPKDRVLVADLGRFVTTAWRNLPVQAPRDLVYTCHFGGIGCGLGQALGAAVAAPDRTTVLVAGDGGFLLSGLSELTTAVTQQMNLVIIVCNDGSYGAEHVQLTNRGMDTALSMIRPPDFAAVARAIGLQSHLVQDDISLTAACDALRAPSGPILIDLRLDADRITL